MLYRSLVIKAKFLLCDKILKLQPNIFIFLLQSLKLQSKSLPFPFTSKEVFEQSIRMPIGPDYNPSISVGALNKPSVSFNF